ncbi:MAG TPA: baseplate J/gp47 family protein [Anaerolineales bacterium]
MKEQILSLEPTDNLQSLRDKITRVQAGRLILLWPTLTEPINRRLDFVLLRRWAAMAGSELILVSADPEVHRLTAQTGIPCYLSLKETALYGLSPHDRDLSGGFTFRKTQTRPPAPLRINFSDRHSPAVRIGVFVSAILSLIVLFLLLIPSVKIHAVFPSRAIEVSKPLDSSLCASLSTHLEFSSRRETTGFIFVPIAYAKGIVLLANKSTRILNLPAGLRVSSKGSIFLETTEGVILLPGKSQSVAASAVKPGPSGNLAAGAIDRVEGPLALSLEATNPGPISGGAQAWRSAVLQADLDALRTSLTDQARQEATKGMQNLATAGRTLVEKSLQVQFDPLDAADFPINTPSDTVGLTLHAIATALECPTDIVRSRAQNALLSGLAPGETLYPSSVTVRLEENAQGAIDLHASGLAVKIPDLNAMALALRARTPGQAAAIMRSRFGARSVVGVDLWPMWIPVLPLFPYQIEIAAGTG